MTRLRAVAALAAIATALVLQGALVVPWAGPVPVSLPAVLVAAVALADGPGVGMGFGFATGLVADLASTHPAGVLALCWLGLGLACGSLGGAVSAPGGPGRSVRRDAATAALACALAGLAAAGLLAAVHGGGAGLGDAFAHFVLAGMGDALLALAVVPVTRRFLRADALRAPRPSEPGRPLVGHRG